MKDEKRDEFGILKADRTCFLCDKPLKRTRVSRWWSGNGPFYGYAGNGSFCSIRCAVDWGVHKAGAMAVERDP